MQLAQLQSGWRTAWVYVPVLLVGVGNAALIGFAMSAVWQRPCRVEGLGDAPCPPLTWDLAPLLIAAGLWLIGLVVWFAGNRTGQTPWLFLLANQVSAAALAVDQLPVAGIDTDQRLFYLLLAWLTPLLLQYHLSVIDTPLRRSLPVLWGLYALALVWTLPLLAGAALATVQAAIRLVFALSVVAALLLLAWKYQRHSSPRTRRRIRLMLFGIVLAFAPLVLLSLLPDTLGAPLYVPYELTFPWLLLSPLFYGYAMFPRQLAFADVLLNRAFVYYLLIVTLLLGYLVLDAALSLFLANPPGEWLLISALMSVLLLLLVAPLQQRLHRVTSWVWYGNDISYRSMIAQLSAELARTLDRRQLDYLLLDQLPRQMGFSRTVLYLKAPNDTLALARSSDVLNLPERLPLSGYLVTHAASHSAPVHHARLERTLSSTVLHPNEQQALAQRGIAHWLALTSGDVTEGLLLLGPRPAGDRFTGEDRQILTTLAYQAGTAAHNVRLIGEVRAGREELARAHRQLLSTQEEERRRLAHELHDEVLQQVLGVRYQIGLLRQQADAAHDTTLAASLDSAYRELLVVVRHLRHEIGTLRPMALDELGLSAVLIGYVDRLRREADTPLPAIDLDVDHISPRLPVHIAICLFRTAQEALRNALRHAQAQRITISLHCEQDALVLRVRDDGCGFVVPHRLSEPARSGHYGLVGMAERVEWVGGQFQIHSQPGAGTEVVAVVRSN